MIFISHNTVWKIAKSLKIKAKRRKRFRVVTTDSSHSRPVSPNLLGFLKQPESKNRIWASDITYLKIPGRWLYLCVILDLYSRKVVGWRIQETLEKSIVIEALNMAVESRSPQAGLIFHSDRGSQYASEEFRMLLKQNDFLQSMSRKGNCWDNAWVESWFAQLKIELGEKFESEQSLRSLVFEYIEGFYNRQRLHSALQYMSPEAFEEKVA